MSKNVNNGDCAVLGVFMCEKMRDTELYLLGQKLFAIRSRFLLDELRKKLLFFTFLHAFRRLKVMTASVVAQSVAKHTNSKRFKKCARKKRNE